MDGSCLISTFKGRPRCPVVDMSRFGLSQCTTSDSTKRLFVFDSCSRLVPSGFGTTHRRTEINLVEGPQIMVQYAT